MASTQSQLKADADILLNPANISEDSDDDLSVLNEEPSANGLPSKKRLKYDFGLSDESNDETLEDNSESEDDYEEEEESDDQEEQSSDWNSNYFEPEIVEFTGNPGLKVSAPSKNKLEWLELFLTPELVEHIVTETNRYAEQFFLSERISFSTGSAIEGPFSARRRKDWKPVTKHEMYHFLALHILTGINRRPDIRMYWSKSNLLNCDIFRRVMNRTRFLTIQKFLHFCNNDDIQKNNNDKLVKIREVVEYFNNRFKSVYIPTRHIAIDEALLKWKGRLQFKVYMPEKPDRSGIKSYVLAESLSGYVWNFDIYCGVSKSIPNIVLNLLDDLINKGYFLFMDNFYNSVKLSELLLSKNTYVCGALRKNRGEPKKIKDVASRLKPEETFFMRRGQVYIQLWRSTRVVTTISTMHAPKMKQVKTMRNPNGIMKPETVLDYNKYMKAVDKCDQMVKYYPCFRKTIKWQKKVFFHLINISCLNALILYNRQFPNQKTTLLDFMISIIREMLKKGGDICRPSTSVFHSSSDPVHRLSGKISDHTLIPNSPGRKGQSKMRRCRVCAKKNTTKRSSFRCKECNVVLCTTPCFKIYHSQENYRISL